MKRILIAEEEPVLLRSLVFTLKRFQYQVCGVLNGNEAVNYLTSAKCGNFDLLVTDIQLPGKTGLEIIDEIRDSGLMLPILVITAYGDRSVLAELRKRDITEFLTKPFNMEELLIRVGRIFATLPH